VNKLLIVTATLAVMTASTAVAQKSDFRWVHAGSDSAVWQEVQAAFGDELAAERDDPQSHTLPMTVKFIDRVGLRGSSALVLVGEKENQQSPYVVFRAFSFDLGTKAKVAVRSTDVEWFWMVRVEREAHLASADDTDILFQFLSCTECEAERLLGSFHYSESAGSWELRQWSEEDGAAPMIGSDTQYGDDGFYHYDCLHAIGDLTGDGLDDVAVRCQERRQPDPDKPQMRVTWDETLLFTAGSDGKLTRVVIGRTSPNFTAVQSALCATKPGSRLCRGRAKAPSRTN
jgi:hypothetical protein